MSSIRKIAKNTTLLFISQLITYLLGFFITMYTARYLGADGFGILSLALAFTGISVVFTDLGLGTLTTREVARDKTLTDKYVGNVGVIKLLLAFLTFGLTVLYCKLAGYSPQICNVIYLITVSIILNAFSGVFYAIFQAHEKLEYQSVSGVLNTIAMFVGTVLAIYYHLNVVGFAFLYIISNAICLVYTLIVYNWKLSLPKIDIDLNFWKVTMITALPLSLVSIFSVIAFRIDTVMLSLIKGTIAVGWYSASYRLMEVLLFLPGVFTTAIFPVFSSFYVSSRDSLKFSYQKSIKYLTIISLPIAVGTTFLSNEIIMLIYSNSFAPSIIILQILIWTIPITFLNYIFGSILPAMDKQTVLLKITFISMVSNVVLNLIFIPRFSYLGAAVVTVLTEMLIAGLSFYSISKSFHKVPLHKIIIKPSIACAVMALFLISVKLNLFVMILSGATIYFIVLFALKTFDEQDLEIFKRLRSMKE